MNGKQQEKAARFRALHDSPGAFVMPNPWDVGSARLLGSLGFPALATSSAASALAMGRRDGELTRKASLSHAREIVGATNLPVSADLEDGFGGSPSSMADTIWEAVGAGLVGCSIEDSTRHMSKPLHDLATAAERISVAARIARLLDFPFLITARAHNFLYPEPSLEDTILRLQAYAQAGADVLFAPGLPDLSAVREVCAAVSKPVNFMIGISGQSFSIAELTAAGVKRISLATSLYRAAMTGLLQAAREVLETGQFTFVDKSLTTPDLQSLMQL